MLPPTPLTVLRCGPLALDVHRLQVSVRGTPVRVSGLQLKLLLHFMRHPDWVFSREQLLSEVWGGDASERDPKVVDVLVSRLRRRLGPAAGDHLESVRHFGYRLRAAADEAPEA